MLCVVNGASLGQSLQSFCDNATVFITSIATMLSVSRA